MRPSVIVKTVLALSFILTFGVAAHAQQLIAYKSIQDYLNNKPTDTISAEIKGFLVGGENMANDIDYKIFNKKQKDFRKVKRNVKNKYWVVRKGDSCFINCKKTVGRHNYACILHQNQDVIYYRAPADYRKEATFFYWFGIIGLLVLENKHYDYITYVGELYTMQLNNYNLKKLLKEENKELYEQYKAEIKPNDTEVKLKYIKLLYEGK